MNSGAVSNEQAAKSEEFDARCAQWIQEMAVGSEQALGELFDATLTKVYGVAVRIVGDAALAEEVASSVYHEAWKSAARYEKTRGRPITWLLTICRNRALDEVRRESSVARTAEAAASLAAPEHVIEPDTLLEATETGHAVRDLLEEISPDDRQLIALAYFRGLSQQQIADYLRLPLGTVKSRMRRALTKLGAAAPPALQQ